MGLDQLLQDCLSNWPIYDLWLHWKNKLVSPANRLKHMSHAQKEECVRREPNQTKCYFDASWRLLIYPMRLLWFIIPLLRVSTQFERMCAKMHAFGYQHYKTHFVMTMTVPWQCDQHIQITNHWWSRQASSPKFQWNISDIISWDKCIQHYFMVFSLLLLYSEHNTSP